MRIAAFSDTHTKHAAIVVPDADVLLFAGDLMGSGYRHDEIKGFGKWFSDQPHKYKVLIAGNHDRMFETNREYCLSKFSSSVIYLENSGVEIEGIKFWGSPQTPFFLDWAFNVQPDRIKVYWDEIPSGTDVLVTHGPPMGVLDKVVPLYHRQYEAHAHLGCPELMDAVYSIQPVLHIFGHIHGGHGASSASPSWRTKTRFHNVSVCNEAYQPVNLVDVLEV
jgi:Icc-related predicted phosphoesterase